MEKKAKLEKRFEDSRRNLLLFTALTIVNCVMLYMKLDFSFSFAGIFPVLAIVYGWEFTGQSGDSIYTFFGTALAVLFIALLLLVYFSTKHHRSFIYVGLGLFIYDCFFLGFYIYLGFMPTDVIDILFHIWFGYYIFSGVLAYDGLKDFYDISEEKKKKTGLKKKDKKEDADGEEDTEPEATEEADGGYDD